MHMPRRDFSNLSYLTKVHPMINKLYIFFSLLSTSNSYLYYEMYSRGKNNETTEVG